MIRPIPWLLVLALAAAPAAAAQTQGAPGVDAKSGSLAPADSALEAQARQLAAELRCPVCQGLSLQDSPSELSQEMKDLIRERLRAGDSPDEVKAYFVGRYGEWILLEPRARGFNLAVWVVPVGALLAGVLLVVMVVRRWTRKPISAPTALGEEDRARVRRELEKLEAERD